MRSWKFFLPLLATSLCFATQPDRITSPIDSSQMVPLQGNVRGLVHPGSDLGRTDSAQVSYGVTLVFHPSARSKLTSIIFWPSSSSLRPELPQWLTPAQFADRFGMTQVTSARYGLARISGLYVTSVANSRNQISFDGTVAQNRIRLRHPDPQYLVDGVIHFANATNPRARRARPSSGDCHLHNFSPKPRAIVRRLSPNATDPHFTSDVSGNHFLSPGDFATSTMSSLCIPLVFRYWP